MPEGTVRAQAIFLALAGQEEKKKRPQARELELFFLSPRIPLVDAPPSRLPTWGALNVSARTDQLAAAAKASHGKGPQQKWHGNGKSDACYRPVRWGVGKSGWGQDLPDTATAATLWLVRNPALRDYHRVGFFSFFFSFFLINACHLMGPLLVVSGEVKKNPN